MISEAEFKETELYHGWFKPRGWLHSFGITLDTTETEQIYFFGIRPPNRPFGEEASLKALAPHLAQATRLAKSQWALQNENNRLRFGAAKIDPLAHFKLTPREFRVATELALGQDIKDMAHKAGQSVATVRWHVNHVLGNAACGVNGSFGLHRSAQIPVIKWF